MGKANYASRLGCDVAKSFARRPISRLRLADTNAGASNKQTGPADRGGKQGWQAGAAGSDEQGLQASQALQIYSTSSSRVAGRLHMSSSSSSANK